MIRLKRKIFAQKGFSPDTYNAMVNSAATNATPDAQKLLDGYTKKYQKEISSYKNSTALTTSPKPNNTINFKNTNSTKPKVGAWGKMGTLGKVGVGAAGIAGGYLLGKGLGLWGNNKN